VTSPRRTPLSRDRVLRAAAALADRDGIGALTMRKLGQELGVEAMSLYKHVANKDEVLDGLAELVLAEFELPTDDVGWREAMHRRASSARTALTRHPWAPAVISRSGPLPLLLSTTVAHGWRASAARAETARRRIPSRQPSSGVGSSNSASTASAMPASTSSLLATCL